MVQKPRFRASRITRAFALLLAAAVPMSVVPVWAAEPIGNGVTPTYDEAYYATLDYYGNLTEGSVVKSYALNGVTTLTDYGVYDEVVNLTDGTLPTSRDGVTTFQFDESNTPSHFYFEGKTTAPFTALPWTISMSYLLNGVPTKAEDLAGKTGVVDINLDIVPNEAASDYAKNNYTLEAMALFNQDDILSLKADGAQVQLVGNLRMVLFLALPGEEQHFTIEVGAEDFSFGGMTFLMVPATLAQLDQIADLSSRKDELEDDYEKLNKSLDTTLDALSNMTGSLYASASGLDQLNKARGIISAGKGTIYDGIDTSKMDFENIAALLDPMAEQVQAASQTLTNSKATLKTLVNTAVSMKTELADLENDLKNLEHNADNAQEVMWRLRLLQGSLKSLQTALLDINTGSSGGQGSSQSGLNQDTLNTVVSLHNTYDGLTAAGGNRTVFYKGFFVNQGYPDTQATGMANACASGNRDLIYSIDSSGKLLAAYDKLNPLCTAYDNTPSPKDFKGFCTVVTGDASKAALMNNLWEVYTSGDKAALELILAAMGGLNDTVSSAGDSMSSVATSTANLAGGLARVCDEMGSLANVMGDVSGIAGVSQKVTKKASQLLDDVQNLHNAVDAYEPKLQETLKTLEDLSVTAAGSIRNAEKLITDTENLAKTSGVQLDAGTKQTLEGLASALRRTAAALATSKDIKDTKSNLDSIITDTWHEHTGDVDNLLNMDSTASPVSLTSLQNPTPQSVQVLIRSQEIKVPDEEDTETAAVAADKGTFWSRVGQMFKDLWSAMTGIFH